MPTFATLALIRVRQNFCLVGVNGVAVYEPPSGRGGRGGAIVCKNRKVLAFVAPLRSFTAFKDDSGDEAEVGTKGEGY